ncbi:calcium-binding protein [Rhodobacteraceae bacterium KMM 6894]|nr:calcium-binding protein [Rhodobacteraceae bacterium KMM 6894]
MPVVYSANYTPNGFGTFIANNSYLFLNGYYILGNNANGINVANGTGSGSNVDLTLANSILTGAFTGVQLDGRDTLTLTNNGTITSGAKGIVALSGYNSIRIDGMLSSEDEALDITGNHNNISVSGSIYSDDDAIVVDGYGTDMVVSGDIQLTEYGNAIALGGAGNTVLISGNILAELGRAFSSTGATHLNITGNLNSKSGVFLGASGNQVHFTGSMYSHFHGFSFTGSDNDVDIGGTSSGNYSLLSSNGGSDNYYTISGNMHSGRNAVQIQDGTNNTVKINGTGSVTGGSNAIGDPDIAAGVILFDSQPGEENTLLNFGSITAELNRDLGTYVAVVDAEFTDDVPGFVENTSGVLNFFNHGSVHGHIYMGAGDDLYDGVGGHVTSTSNIYLGRGDDVAIGGAGRERIYGDDGNDDIEGGADKDRIYDGEDDDIVDAGDGNDYVRVGGGQDTYYGGEGKDYISYYDSSNGVRLDLEANTAAWSWASNDAIDGFESASGSRTGNDKIYGTSTSNTIKTYGGEDRLYGRDGGDRLYGGDDNDKLYGGRGADQLYGGDGGDFLDGGTGDELDLLYGEGGADYFHFDRGEGNDIVMDFEDNTDTIEFDNFGYLSTAADALSYAAQTGSDVLFDFGSDGTLRVERATMAQLLSDVDIV